MLLNMDEQTVRRKVRKLILWPALRPNIRVMEIPESTIRAYQDRILAGKTEVQIQRENIKAGAKAPQFGKLQEVPA